MKIQSIFEILGYISLGTTISLPILSFVGKKIFDNLISKNLEKFKNELNKETIRHQILLSNLHQERANATKKIFKAILELENSTIRYTISFSQNQLKGVNKKNYKIHLEHLDKIMNKMNSLSQIISEYSLYFSSESVLKIRKFRQEYNKTFIALGRKIESNIDKLEDNSFLEPYFFENNNEKLNRLINESKSYTESEFRKLIGVE